MSERARLLHSPPQERDGGTGSFREALAEGLESASTHRLVISLIAIDALCVLIDISWQLLDDKCPPNNGGSTQPISEDPEFLEFLRNISLVITTLFLIEIPLVLWAFSWRYYFGGRRWGLHLLDATVVVVTFALEMTLKGRESEIAGLLILARLWRLVKLVEGSVVEMGEWDEEAAVRASTLKRIARLFDLDPNKTKPEVIYRHCQELKDAQVDRREL